MIRRPPRSTLSSSSAASDVYKRQVYANTLLSERGIRYVRQQSAAIVQILAGDDTQSTLAQAIDFSLLKHKELDELLTVAKLWADGMEFKCEAYWDERLRQYYKSRYDARKNAADWDYHMKLKPLGAEIVNSREFTRWRLTGVAFEFGDKSYNKENFTLGCYAAGREKNRSVVRHGYWGDVVNSPYLAHGVIANKESLYKTRNNEHCHTSSDVSKYNATKLLHAFMEGKDVDPPVTATGIGGDHSETPGDKVVEQVSEEKPADSFPKAKLVLMLGEPQQLLRRQKYLELFDSVFIANTSAGEDWSTVVSTIAPQGYLAIESAKFVLDFRKDHKTEFLRRLYESGRESGLQLLPMTHKKHQGKGAARCGEETAMVSFLKPDCVDVPGEGTIAIPELEVPENLKQDDKQAEEVDPAEGEPESEEIIAPSKVPAPERTLKSGADVDWQIVQRHQTRSSNRPRELLLRVKMPGLKSVSALQLDIEEQRVVVKHEASPAVDLDIVLPFPVDPEGGNAKFDSEKSTLSVTLDVIAVEEDAKDALLHLENVEEGEEQLEGSASEDSQEHIMVREQKALGRGMAIPSKLGQNLLF
eukprot:TRINITY_DN1488_c0_g1_i3.p1 TRINITY_DN1488_c0_g1~~TRINITY_DN1488_c0_g1_i3.p1  ORF type:complete len:587 (+),score=143.20 TRINITY_DN1488_c0_g1_i3:88-1848(+)